MFGGRLWVLHWDRQKTRGYVGTMPRKNRREPEENKKSKYREKYTRLDIRNLSPTQFRFNKFNTQDRTLDYGIQGSDGTTGAY